MVGAPVVQVPLADQDVVDVGVHLQGKKGKHTALERVYDQALAGVHGHTERPRHWIPCCPREARRI
jgi:hypothetical protein